MPGIIKLECRILKTSLNKQGCSVVRCHLNLLSSLFHRELVSIKTAILFTLRKNTTRQIKQVATANQHTGSVLFARCVQPETSCTKCLKSEAILEQQAKRKGLARRLKVKTAVSKTFCRVIFSGCGKKHNRSAINLRREFFLFF